MTDLTKTVLASSVDVAQTDPTLCWAQQDIEQRIGFRGGRFTRVNNFLSFLVGGVLTLSFYGILAALPETWIAQTFTQRGPTPYVIALFSWWSVSILFFKWRKHVFQSKALEHDVVPAEHDFVLSVSTVDQVLTRIHSLVDDPRYFLLYNRIVTALANLRNLGRIGDVDELFRSQVVHDESALETSYAVMKGLIWAIPVLGFIGTVIGLSEAIGGFSQVLASTAELSQITDALKLVTGGLATAFETTLQALVAAVVIQLVLTLLRKSEDEFLDACSDYCLRRVVNRVRIMPFEEEAPT